VSGELRLRGLHHVSAVTADAPGTMRFYAGLLGLDVVKRTVDFDSPDIWHVYFGDERGTPGSLVTFFEFPNAGPGRAGTTLAARLRLAVASEDELGALAERLAEAGAELQASGTLAFTDPEGIEIEVAIDAARDEPGLRLHGVTLHGDPAVDAPVLDETLGTPEGAVDHVPPPPPPVEGELGSGTIHHVAWIVAPEELEAWRERLVDAGLDPTPIRDRRWFRSVYFRLPGGVLFELATDGPGMAADGLSDRLELPEWFEDQRPRLERSLTPLPSTDRITPWRADR
jgi:glyoxalase family protein